MRNLLPALAMMAATTVAHATTINFADTVTGSSISPYTEAGFTASVLSGAVFYSRGSVGKFVGGDELGGGGLLSITANNGSPFIFSGLDYSAFFNSTHDTGLAGTQTLVVRGYLHGLPVATESYTLTDFSFNFTPEGAGSLSGLALDQLTINLQAGRSSDNTVLYSENVTNIVVNPGASSTPEPSTLALAAAGALGLAGAVRKRFPSK